MTRGNTTPKKVLVIGSTGHAGAKCVDWTALKDVPNIADFHVVVVNGCTLGALIDRLKVERDSANEERAEAARKLGSLVSDNLALLKSKLIQVLRAGGAVYGVPGPFRTLIARGVVGYYAIVESRGWIPLPVGFEDEPGDTLSVADKRFARYFATVKRWEEVFDDKYDTRGLDPLTDGELDPKPLVRLAVTKLATDWRGNAAAAEVRYGLYRLSRREISRALGHDYEDEPYVSSGPLVLLPPPTEVSDEEAVRILLEDFCGVQARSVAPGWARSTAMPGDDARRAAAAEARKALEVAQRMQQETLAAQVAADEFRRLLYETGLPLQDAARRTFEAIGVGTADSPVSDEFMLVRGDRKVLVEVTGVGKSVATRDLSQLIKDMGNYLAGTDEPIKGLLVGNAWRDLPLEERDSGDKPIFPVDLVKTARSHSVALLSTIELYRAYCAFLDGKLDVDQAFQRIVDTSGPVKLVD
jgi:hypothetical protein